MADEIPLFIGIAIQNVANGQYLDVNESKSKTPADYRPVLIVNDNLYGAKSLHWTLDTVGDDIYSIRSKRMVRTYLNGGGDKIRNTNSDSEPYGEQNLQWKFESLGGDKFAIKSVAKGKYLSGKNSQDILQTAGNPSTDPFLTWKFVSC